jgi:methylase of polypeptide subunit release factors
LQQFPSCHAVICLGCVIKGDTDHDIYINNAISQGIMQLNLTHAKPVIFGVLTTNNLQQALDRAGTGSYYAITAAKIAIELRDYEAETFDMLDKALKYAEDNKDDDKVKIVEDLRQQFYEVLSIPR